MEQDTARVFCLLGPRDGQTVVCDLVVSGRVDRTMNECRTQCRDEHVVVQTLESKPCTNNSSDSNFDVVAETGNGEFCFHVAFFLGFG